MQAPRATRAVPITADLYALSTNRDSASPAFPADTELTQYPTYVGRGTYGKVQPQLS